MKVSTVRRPYVLTFLATGTSYPLSSDEAQRLLDAYPVVRATTNYVTLRGDDGHTSRIAPATLGGGPAFELDRTGERGDAEPVAWAPLCIVVIPAYVFVLIPSVIELARHVF